MMNSTTEAPPAPPRKDERPGAAYFRLRGWIPIPLYAGIVAGLPWRSPRVVETLAGGLALLALGLLFRLWSIRHIGHRARTHSQKTRPLVETGPYAALRNPLYVANILIATGFTLAMGHLVYAPILAVLLWAHYHVVVLCEEAGLRERHPEGYHAYQVRTPRWFPMIFRKAVWAPANFSLGEALYRERSGILGVGLGLVALAFWTWFRLR